MTFPVDIEDLTEGQVEKSLEILRVNVIKTLDAGQHSVDRDDNLYLRTLLANEGFPAVEADDEAGIDALDAVAPLAPLEVLGRAVDFLNALDEEDGFGTWGWRTRFNLGV